MTELLELTHTYLSHVELGPHRKVASKIHIVRPSCCLLSHPESDTSEAWYRPSEVLAQRLLTVTALQTRS